MERWDRERRYEALRQLMVAARLRAGRPLVGAVFGVIGYFIFVALIQSTGTTPAVASGRAAIPYFIVAFILGYREESFRDLIIRAVDLLFRPAEKKSTEPTE